MRFIKIIKGAYGYRSEGSTLTCTKTSADKAFVVSDAEASRLIALGVAKYDDGAPARPSNEPEDMPVAKPEYNAGTNANVLKGLMKKAGIKVAVGMKKEDMVSALNAFYAGEGIDGKSDLERPQTPIDIPAEKAAGAISPVLGTEDIVT